MNLRNIIREELEGSFFTDIHGKKSSPVDYTAVVIKNEDLNFFIENVKEVLKTLNISVSKNWSSPEEYHMTITKGPLGLGHQMSGVIGSVVSLEVVSLGVSDDAIALGVSGYYSRNKNPHITFLYRKDPKDSNDIINWIKIQPFEIEGEIREINKKDGWGRLGNIEESYATNLINENQKLLPKTFDHLKWKLNNNQKYFLDDLCGVNPNSLTESDIKNASKFLGIPEKNLKSIINTYSYYDEKSEKFLDLFKNSPLSTGNKPIVMRDILSVEEMNKAPQKHIKTFYQSQQNKTSAEKKTMDYAITKNRLLNRSGKISEVQKKYNSIYKSLMIYLFCEINPKDINLNHKNQIQIDQEPILLEGEDFSKENYTFRKIDNLIKSFNQLFDTNFRISDHIDLSETSHKCHRTFVEHFGISKNKMFWCSEKKKWVSYGEEGYEKLKEEYKLNQGRQMQMLEIKKVDIKDLLKKYLNGDLISYNPNSEWIY